MHYLVCFFFGFYKIFVVYNNDATTANTRSSVHLRSRSARYYRVIIKINKCKMNVSIGFNPRFLFILIVVS